MRVGDYEVTWTRNLWHWRRWRRREEVWFNRVRIRPRYILSRTAPPGSLRVRFVGGASPSSHGLPPEAPRVTP